MRNLSLGRRHLVNAYEVEAGIGVTASNTVWSMPERLECEVLQKVRYINTSPAHRSVSERSHFRTRASMWPHLAPTKISWWYSPTVQELPRRQTNTHTPTTDTTENNTTFTTSSLAGDNDSNSTYNLFFAVWQRGFMPIQEAQLSQRCRAMIYVIKYLAKSLKVTRDDTPE